MKSWISRYTHSWRYNLSSYQKISLVFVFLLVLILPLLTMSVLHRVFNISKAAPITPPTPPISPPPNPFGQAVQISGSSYFTVDNSTLNFNPQLGFTVEAWVKPEGIGYKKIVDRTSSNQSSYILTLNITENSQNPGSYVLTPHFGVVNSGNSCLMHSIMGQSNLSGEDAFKWHHIAGVVQSNGQMDIYFDGLRSIMNFNSITGTCARQFPARVGSENYNGLIDEVRISNVSRYPNNFIPSLLPFSEDEFTTLLYHFDSNLLDSSGNNRNALPSGGYTFVESTIGQTYPKPTILTTSLSNGKVGTTYQGTVRGQQLTTYVPLDMLITNLPAGLSMSNCSPRTTGENTILTCAVTGTPTQSGDFSVGVTLTDIVGGSSQATLLLKIRP